MERMQNLYNPGQAQRAQEALKFSGHAQSRLKSRGIDFGDQMMKKLETAVDKSGKLQPFVGETNIFIRPGYKFKVIDKMFTNFHLPKSTLFILVAALAGLHHVKSAYVHAISEKYRFFSYGDACLIERSND